MRKKFIDESEAQRGYSLPSITQLARGGSGLNPGLSEDSSHQKVFIGPSFDFSSS
jgi:hypothetical protein